MTTYVKNLLGKELDEVDLEVATILGCERRVSVMFVFDVF